MEAELAALIGRGEVAARIDSAAHVMYARKGDARAATYRDALAAGEGYLAGTKAMLLRASLVRHDLIQVWGGVRGLGLGVGGGCRDLG